MGHGRWWAVVVVAVAVAVVTGGVLGSSLRTTPSQDGPWRRDGARVGADVISVIRGPRHCEGQSSRGGGCGWARGGAGGGGAGRRTYVRDPLGVLAGSGGRIEAFRANVELPRMPNGPATAPTTTNCGWRPPTPTAPCTWSGAAPSSAGREPPTTWPAADADRPAEGAGGCAARGDGVRSLRSAAGPAAVTAECRHAAGRRSMGGCARGPRRRRRDRGQPRADPRRATRSRARAAAPGVGARAGRLPALGGPGPQLRGQGPHPGQRRPGVAARPAADLAAAVPGRLRAGAVAAGGRLVPGRDARDRLVAVHPRLRRPRPAGRDVHRPRGGHHRAAHRRPCRSPTCRSSTARSAGARCSSRCSSAARDHRRGGRRSLRATTSLGSWTTCGTSTPTGRRGPPR